MTHNYEKPLRLYPYLLITVSIVILLSLSYIYYRSEHNHEIGEKYETLSSIGALKSDFLSNWYKERLTEAQFLSDNSNFPIEIEQYILSGNYDREHISSHLNHIIADGKYENIMLINAKGFIFYSVLQNYSLGKESAERINSIFTKKKTIVTDFYYCDEYDKIYFDIISPVKVHGRIIAALVLRVDPNTSLFPIMQQWPIPSKSAEVILVKRIGDSVLFLNKMRKVNNLNLEYYHHISETDIPAVKAANHYTGLYRGKDYNGDDVISDIRSIPGTGWFLVVKVDTAELMAEFQKRAILIAIVVVLISLVFGIVIALGFIRRQKNIYKQLLDHRSRLFQTQSELGTTLYAIANGIIVTDEQGKITHMNHGAEQLTSWHEKDAVGNSFEKVCVTINEDSREPLEDLATQIIRERKASTPVNHTLLLSVDGKETPISQNGAPIIDEKGQFTGVVIVISDRSEERLKNKLLKQSEERLSSMVSHLPGFIYRCNNDKDWSILYVSDGVEKITEYTAGELVHDIAGFNELILPEYRELIAELWEKAIEQQLFFEYEYKIQTASKQERWVWERGKAVYDENGKVLFLEGYIEDISERKNNELALKDSEEKYRLLLENSLDAILLTKPQDGSIISVNKATSDLFGMDEQEICLRGRDGMVDLTDPRLHELLEIRSKTGKVKGELNFFKKDGSVFTAEFTSALFKNSHGELMSSMILRDMTLIKENERVLKQLNTDLMNAKLKAEESDRLKMAFLANMSHEIRTPMNGILGFLELIKEPDLNDETRKEYISFINLSGQRLLNTINDIIEISKIESGEIDIKLSNLNLSEVFGYFADFFSIQAKEKNIELIINEQIKDDAALILSDRHKIDSILTNLIRNAIKFTKEGSVEIGNYIENDKLVIYVKDTGIGIHPSKQNTIFDRFVQADLHYSRDYEGSGLGLAIVKAYAEAMKGEISLISEPYKGSTFTVKIPYLPSLESQMEKRQPSESKNAYSDLKILIAEDDEISFRYLKNILRNDEFQLIRAINGYEAVDILRNNPEISLILMDIKMSELDGYEATKLIRKFNQTIPIIAQTAYAFTVDRDKAFSVGCNDFISKPVKKTELLKLIDKYLYKSYEESQ